MTDKLLHAVLRRPCRLRYFDYCRFVGIFLAAGGSAPYLFVAYQQRWRPLRQRWPLTPRQKNRPKAIDTRDDDKNDSAKNSLSPKRAPTTTRTGLRSGTKAPTIWRVLASRN
jgi:hypothetical protein